MQPHRAGRTLLRPLLLIVLIGGAWSVTAVPAAADVTGPCDGSVTIDGITYTPANDSAADPIVVPEDASTASWQGTTGAPITDYTGEVTVAIGPGAIRIASWGGANTDQETSAEGDYAIADARGELPTDLVGLYELHGTHSGTGGTCEAMVMVRLEGSPLSTPLGAGGVVATAVGLAGVALAGAGAAKAAAAAGGG